MDGGSTRSVRPGRRCRARRRRRVAACDVLTAPATAVAGAPLHRDRARDARSAWARRRASDPGSSASVEARSGCSRRLPRDGRAPGARPVDALGTGRRRRERRTRSPGCPAEDRAPVLGHRGPRRGLRRRRDERPGDPVRLPRPGRPRVRPGRADRPRSRADGRPLRGRLRRRRRPESRRERSRLYTRAAAAGDGRRLGGQRRLCGDDGRRPRPDLESRCGDANPGLPAASIARTESSSTATAAC